MDGEDDSSPESAKDGDGNAHEDDDEAEEAVKEHFEDEAPGDEEDVLARRLSEEEILDDVDWITMPPVAFGEAENEDGRGEGENDPIGRVDAGGAADGVALKLFERRLGGAAESPC